MLLVSYLRNYCQDQCYEAFPLCLYSFWSFKSLLWVDLRIWYKIGFQFHSFACKCPVFTAPFVEEIILSPLCSLNTHIKDYLTICAWVYFWAICSVPLVCMFIFMSVLFCQIISTTIALQCILKSGHIRPSVFSFPSEDCFGVLWSSIWILGFILFVQKCHWDFDGGCTEFVDLFGYCGHFNNIKPCNTWTQCRVTEYATPKYASLA